MSYYYLSDKQLATMITSLNKTCRDAATRELLESLSYQKLKSSTDQSNYRKAAMDKMTKIDVAAVKNEDFQVDEDATVSNVVNGAYVQCWLWVDAETKPKRSKRTKA